MTLGEIKAIVLKGMGVYNDNLQDENPGQQYEPMLTSFINDGYMLAGKKYRAMAWLTLDTDGRGMIALSELPGLIRVEMVTDESGGELLWSISKCGLLLRVCVEGYPAKVRVLYARYPDRLRDDAEVPAFEPEGFHSMLAEYAMYRLMGMHPIGDTKAAEAHYAMFREMLAGIRPQKAMGAAEELRNKYAVRW